MPEQGRTLDAELRVVDEPPLPRVLLGGLPPVYARGLQAVLQGSVASCTVVAELTTLPVLLTGPHPHVVVVPEAALPIVLPVGPATSKHAVVVLVERLAADECARVLRAGATGVLSGADAPARVMAVLRSAAQGEAVLPREVVQALCRPATLPSPSLTVVELAWLRRLATGGTVAGLARACDYSEREMYRRLSDVYLRLGARTRTEALLLAERFGLLGHQD